MLSLTRLSLTQSDPLIASVTSLIYSDHRRHLSPNASKPPEGCITTSANLSDMLHPASVKRSLQISVKYDQQFANIISQLSHQRLLPLVWDVESRPSIDGCGLNTQLQLLIVLSHSQRLASIHIDTPKHTRAHQHTRARARCSLAFYLINRVQMQTHMLNITHRQQSHRH